MVKRKLNQDKLISKINIEKTLFSKYNFPIIIMFLLSRNENIVLLKENLFFWLLSINITLILSLCPLRNIQTVSYVLLFLSIRCSQCKTLRGKSFLEINVNKSSEHLLDNIQPTLDFRRNMFVYPLSRTGTGSLTISKVLH